MSPGLELTLYEHPLSFQNGGFARVVKGAENDEGELLCSNLVDPRLKDKTSYVRLSKGATETPIIPAGTLQINVKVTGSGAPFDNGTFDQDAFTDPFAA